MLRNKEINSPIAVLVGGAKYMMTHGLSFTVMPDQGVDMNAVRGIIGGDLRLCTCIFSRPIRAICGTSIS